MKLAIIGSRSFKDHEVLNYIINTYFSDFEQCSCGNPDGSYEPRFDEIVSGGAVGADQLGARWAKDNGVKLTEFIPDWAKYGKRAGFIRNEDIIKAADFVLAFWDGTSRGTANSLSIAKRLKKSTLIIYF